MFPTIWWHQPQKGISSLGYPNWDTKEIIKWWIIIQWSSCLDIHRLTGLDPNWKWLVGDPIQWWSKEIGGASRSVAESQLIRRHRRDILTENGEQLVHGIFLVGNMTWYTVDFAMFDVPKPWPFGLYRKFSPWDHHLYNRDTSAVRIWERLLEVRWNLTISEFVCFIFLPTAKRAHHDTFFFFGGLIHRKEMFFKSGHRHSPTMQGTKDTQRPPKKPLRIWTCIRTVTPVTGSESWWSWAGRLAFFSDI